MRRKTQIGKNLELKETVEPEGNLKPKESRNRQKKPQTRRNVYTE